MNIEYVWLATGLSVVLRLLMKHEESVKLSTNLTPKERRLERIGRVSGAIMMLLAFITMYPIYEQMVDPEGMDIGWLAIITTASITYNADSIVPKAMRLVKKQVMDRFQTFLDRGSPS